MERSFFSYKSDLCAEENLWAELYRRNSLAERGMELCICKYL